LVVSATRVTTGVLAAASVSPSADQVTADVIAIREGADLDLSCPIVVQNDDMIISWTCDSDPANIRSSRIHITESGKLRIRSAKPGDSCNYRCEAADGFGTLSVILKVVIVDRRLMEHFAPSSNGRDADRPKQIAQPSLGASQLAGRDGEKLAPQEDKSSGVSVMDQLDVQIEPAAIYVTKNRTFSLECKVRHPINLVEPQIIWLKEFIGRKPASPNEAHEQNLVLIDNIYYHSLNWPRSVTYSRKSSCTNSALLVRQSKFVHSGRYVCFAGYPPTTMASNLTSTTSGHPFKPLKYRMAHATVKVDDPEGETSHQLSLESRERKMGELQPESLWADVVLSNNWTRNLTLIMTLICLVLYLARVVHSRYRLKGKMQGGIENRQSSREGGGNISQAAYQTEHVDSIPDNLSNSKQSNTDGPNINQSRYSTHQARAELELMLSDCSPATSINDHLYSEIGERVFDANKLEATQTEGDYKVPVANRTIALSQ